MFIETTVSKIGNSLCLVLPPEAVNALQVDEGATVYLTKGTDGSIRMTTGGPEFAKVMAVAERVMNKYQNALRELSK